MPINQIISESIIGKINFQLSGDNVIPLNCSAYVFGKYEYDNQTFNKHISEHYSRYKNSDKNDFELILSEFILIQNQSGKKALKARDPMHVKYKSLEYLQK